MTDSDLSKHPFAFQKLMGLVSYFNEFSNDEIETSQVEVNGKTLVLLFNCHDESLADILGQPVGINQLQLSFSQNLLDNWMMPHYVKIDSDILKMAKDSIRKNGFGD